MASRLRPADVPLPTMAGMRGLAAIAILTFHVSHATGLSQPGAVGRWLSVLPIVAVGIFIGQSGFFLVHPLSLAHLKGDPHRPFDLYIARRLGRILPAYWAALAGMVLILGSGTIQGWDWLPILTLTHVYTPDLGDAGLIVAWTVAVEVAFYFFVPPLFWAIRKVAPAESTTVRQRFRVQMWAVVAVLAFGIAFRIIVLIGPDSWNNTTRFWMPNWVSAFAAGMVFAVLLSWRKLGNPMPAWMDWLLQRPWLCVVFALELYWVDTHLGVPAGLLNGAITDMPGGSLAFLALSLFIMIPLLCLPGVFFDGGRSLYHRFLASTPLLYLGGISYSLYLWHIIFVNKFRELQLRGDWPDGFWALEITVLVVSVVVAALCFALIEQPALKVVATWFARSGRTASKFPASTGTPTTGGSVAAASAPPSD